MEIGTKVVVRRHFGGNLKGVISTGHFVLMDKHIWVTYKEDGHDTEHFFNRTDVYTPTKSLYKYVLNE